MTLDDWGILYGIIASTAALIWQGVEKWQSRRRLDFFIGPGSVTTVEPDERGYTEHHWVHFRVTNVGGAPIVIRYWSVEFKPKAAVATMQPPGLPKKLEPLDSLEFDLHDHDLDPLLRGPGEIYFGDVTGKKWYVPLSVLRAAIETANAARAANQARTKHTPKQLAPRR